MKTIKLTKDQIAIALLAIDARIDRNETRAYRSDDNERIDRLYAECRKLEDLRRNLI